jgi:hypothetical protein
MTERDWYSAKEVAHILRRSEGQLSKDRAKGVGPHWEPYGTGVRYHRASVDAFDPATLPKRGGARKKSVQDGASDALLSEIMTGIVWCLHHGIDGLWVFGVRGPGALARQVHFALIGLQNSCRAAEMAEAEESIRTALAKATPGQIEEVRQLFLVAGVPALRG